MYCRAEREFKWRSLEVKSAPKLENEWQGSITLEGLGSATRYTNIYIFMYI